MDVNDDTFLEIGRELNTGTGETGSGMKYSTAGVSNIPATSGLPSGTPSFNNVNGIKSFSLSSSYSNSSHLGVFYVEVNSEGRKQHIEVLRQTNTGRPNTEIKRNTKLLFIKNKTSTWRSDAEPGKERRVNVTLPTLWILKRHYESSTCPFGRFKVPLPRITS